MFRQKKPFDGWFQNSEAYEKQIRDGYLSCPYCGGLNVVKNIMSPSINGSNKKRNLVTPNNSNKINDLNKSSRSIDVMTVLRNLKREIQNNADFVGKNFAKEAQSIEGWKSEK